MNVIDNSKEICNETKQENHQSSSSHVHGLLNAREGVESDEYIRLGGRPSAAIRNLEPEVVQISSTENDFNDSTDSKALDYQLFHQSQPQETSDHNNNSERISGYLRLLSKNRNYCLYLISHFYRHFGDWFVHVSNIIAVGMLVPDSSTALSILVATKLAANIIFPSIGGLIADSFDRRWVMICLDFGGAFITLGHILAIQNDSVLLLYFVSFARASITATYEPVTRSIVPQIVSLEDLKKAAVLNASAWSMMIMVGGTVAGYTIALFGLELCYYIDTISFSLSVVTMWFVNGKYNTAPTSTKTSFTSAIDPTQQYPSIPKFCLRPYFQFATMFHELKLYLRRCGFGICVLIKASGCLSWGASTVLNYAFAKLDDNEEASYKRIGYIYGSGGLGSLLGPIIVANMLEVKNGKTFQMSIVVGLALQFCGWFGEAFFHMNFFVVCIFTALRTAGSSTIWVFSSLLFQTLVPADILGRVLAFELAVGFTCETIVVVIAGISIDSGHSIQEVAFGQGIVAFFFFSFWFIYYQIAGGKANQILTQEHQRNARIDYLWYNQSIG